MTHARRTLGRLLCVGCLAGLATTETLQAQTRAPTRDRMRMMARCQTTMADMKAEQAKLDDLVAKMNAATGQLKIEQMAAVLTELVAREKAMRARMMCMEGMSAAPANPSQERPETGQEQHRH